MWSQKLNDDALYNVTFRRAGVMEQQLYHPDDDYPAFTSLVTGWVRVHPEVLIVIRTVEVYDPNDQRVNLLLIPWSDVIDIVAT